MIITHATDTRSSRQPAPNVDVYCAPCLTGDNHIHAMPEGFAETEGYGVCCNCGLDTEGYLIPGYAGNGARWVTTAPEMLTRSACQGEPYYLCRSKMDGAVLFYSARQLERLNLEPVTSPHSLEDPRHPFQEWLMTVAGSRTGARPDSAIANLQRNVVLLPAGPAERPGERPSDAIARVLTKGPLEVALRLIRDARDDAAEGLDIPPFPYGPGQDQAFDDWAADVAEVALSLYSQAMEEVTR